MHKSFKISHENMLLENRLMKLGDKWKQSYKIDVGLVKVWKHLVHLWISKKFKF